MNTADAPGKTLLVIMHSTAPINVSLVPWTEHNILTKLIKRLLTTIYYINALTDESKAISNET